jgi:chitinase
VRKYKLGGVMAWSLGEDSFDYSHVRKMASELRKGRSKTAARPKPKPKPRPTPQMMESESGPARPIKPAASKPTFDTVWVDGTPQGPGANDVTTPGSPEDWVVPVEAEASTPQVKEPIVAAPQVESVVPEQEFAPVEQASPAGWEPSTTPEDLPSSPEHLQMVKELGSLPRPSRKARFKGQQIRPSAA